MPHELRIPRLGWSMEEGIFVGWLKQDGDKVEVGEPLYELEGEKALEQIESVDAGTLRIATDCPEPGSVVSVGALIGHLTADGELVPEPRLTESAAASLGAMKSPRETRPVQLDGEPRVLADQSSATKRVVASPRAKRVAKELGVDWTALRGSGAAGRIREADVRGAASALSPRLTMTLSQRRKTIIQRLQLAQHKLLPVTLTATADVNELVALRARWKAEALDITPSYMDLIVGALPEVLKRHRHMAARWHEDHQALDLPRDDEFHIGIAVDTPEGLVVPVLRSVVGMPVQDLAARASQLINDARSGRLTASDMQNGVFTVTSLGALGIDAFTPMIHYPQVAILGLGAIRREPAFDDSGEIVALHRMTLSLTFDHGAMDGAPAAAFLHDLVKTLKILKP